MLRPPPARSTRREDSSTPAVFLFSLPGSRRLHHLTMTPKRHIHSQNGLASIRTPHLQPQNSESEVDCASCVALRSEDNSSNHPSKLRSPLDDKAESPDKRRKGIVESGQMWRMDSRGEQRDSASESRTARHGRRRATSG